jgi:hypothetical protein
MPDVSLHMSDTLEAKDCVGRPVRVGSRVRIIKLSSEFIDSLPADERAQVSEMIGDVFEVDEIDDAGRAWVTKTWDRGDGNFDGHGIALSPSETELVSTDGAG